MTFNAKTARWLAAAVAIATATTVSACGSGNDASASANGGQQQGQQGGPQGTTPGGRGGFQFDTAALAKELGVSESKLQKAIDASRPDFGGNRQRPTTPPNGERPTTPRDGRPGGRGGRMTEMFASIAKELGLSESKVQQAFQSVMPQGGMGRPGEGAGPGGRQLPPDGGAAPSGQEP
ncbi:MAG: hypothetical protein J7513_03550 [Solirubrobacteraceae bacterium]|nr:hypothetical protein [Solirubrobacteraceae bacterium]